MSAIKFLIVLAALAFFADARDIKVTPNPGCDAVKCTETDLRLLQVTSTDGNDQIIFMLSTFGPPTILTAHFDSAKAADATVDWNCVSSMKMSDCVNFTMAPSFSSSITMLRLVEYNDTYDTRNAFERAKQPEQVISTYLDGINWFPTAAKGFSDTKWSLLVNATNAGESDIFPANTTDTYLRFDFDFFNSIARTSIMPGIQHSASAGMVDIVMSNLLSHFNASRFAIEFVTVSDSLPETDITTSVASVDDEYSPGVFQVLTWMMNGDATDDVPSTYIHYKPVSYTKPLRNLESIQPAFFSKVRFFNFDSIAATSKAGLAYAYYGDEMRLRNVESVNVSIGSLQDGFYTSYNYTTFTVVHGVGQPIYDAMSPEVIAAISIGVGVPSVLIVVAVTVVIARMIRKRNEEAAAKKELLVNDQQ